ncbi:MAG: ABC transporter permease subunit [Alphaproteobacteria bacterium]|nr:ABC transporter permease subunit [Alphaproteobacteria bacterium]
MNRTLRIAIPVALGIAVLLMWEALVAAFAVPRIVLPAPSDIGEAFVSDFGTLMAATFVTLRITLIAFVLAVLGGVALAILFAQSRLIETALYPYAVVLQVTPVVAIAPLLTIWIGYDNIEAVTLTLAWIVAFFPVLANTTLGLKSVDRNLIDLFRLYGASRWQILTRLQLPNALPFLLGGMKVSGGLALIGAVVAELAAGSGTSTGLAWILTLATRNLHMGTAFAALALLSALGIAIFFALSALEYWLLHRWHESALKVQT